jgi:hypothetical protein
MHNVPYHTILYLAHSIGEFKKRTFITNQHQITFCSRQAPRWLSVTCWLHMHNRICTGSAVRLKGDSRDSGIHPVDLDVMLQQTLLILAITSLLAVTTRWVILI